MIRTAMGGATFAVASVLALATYEAVVLVLASAGFVFGSAALLWVLLRGAPAVEQFQRTQSARIEALTPPED